MDRRAVGMWILGFIRPRYGDENIVDLHLKHLSWQETALKRPISPRYEIRRSALIRSAVFSRGAMILSDLLTDAEPVTVREKSAAQSLKKWDRIAARVVAEHDHHVISGALLPFFADASICY
jgi:hypothetical protein